MRNVRRRRKAKVPGCGSFGFIRTGARRILLGVASVLFLLPCFASASPIVPDASAVNLDEIGLYDIGYAYRHRPRVDLPMGWWGGFHEKTGVAYQAAGRQGGRRAFMLHPPSRGGTGITFQIFWFTLPAAQRATLRGATSMHDEVVGRSDGVTFRVFANGERLLDVHREDSIWQPFEFDLTHLAGTTVTIRFETDPGPRDDARFDYGLWGGRELAFEGFTPPPPLPWTPPPLDLSRVVATQTGSVAPRTGYSGVTNVTSDGDSGRLSYRGPDGSFEYQWRRPRSADDGLFGELQLYASVGPTAPQRRIALASNAEMEWTQPARFQNSRLEQATGAIVLVTTYEVGDRTATVRAVGRIEGKSLVLDISSDQPYISRLEAGRWGPVLRRRSVTTPFYSGRVDYLPTENLFVNAYLDWTDSSASSHRSSAANYGPLTDGTRNLLRERAIFTAAWHLAEVLPNIPNPPSPYRALVGNKIVLDVWRGTFSDIAKKLEILHDHGIRNCTVLIHVWQRSGYDNALPAHYPANEEHGGEAGMKQLVETGARLGYLVALHENYVDYYPNFDGFAEYDISLDSKGQKVDGWFNEETRTQAYAIKPTAILRLAATQSPEIHRRYGTNAGLLDVHSAVAPWFHVDFRAGEQQAGMFRAVWDAHRKLWQYERDTHGGPVFGEGHQRWYWAGYLDGAEGQFSVGWPERYGMSAPLAVDFNLLKIHPLQIDHGMGYYERWWSRPTWGRVPPMAVLDQYRMQEVIYGHAGFLGGAVWDDVRLAWLEHHLMSPVTARYATAMPAEIDYEVDGNWVDGTEAAKADAWRRARVRYDNGLTITANDLEEPLVVDGVKLPRFGWLARGEGVTAGTMLRDGLVSDYAETETSVFANARPAADWNLTGVRIARPLVADFAQTGVRSVRFSYRWHVRVTPSADYHCLVHFLAPNPGNESVRFKQDHILNLLVSQWKEGQTVVDGPHALTLADDVGDGDYSWTIGLWNGSGRAPLEGPDDGHGRIRLGVLQVRDRGKTITFTPDTTSWDDVSRLFTHNINEAAKVIDFGPLRTNGSVLVERDGPDWVLRPMPRNRTFTVELNADRFGRPATVKSERGLTPTVVPQPAGQWWSLPLNGAAVYRWGSM